MTLSKGWCIYSTF